MESAQRALPGLIEFYEHLKPGDLSRLDAVYAADACFKDPFNEVRGLPAIVAIFEHMFKALGSPHFVVTSRMAQNDEAFLVWEFRFQFKGQSTWQTIRGATHVRFNEQGLVLLHRDYWDAAEELYEKLPILGSLMRWLKRKAVQSP